MRLRSGRGQSDTDTAAVQAGTVDTGTGNESENSSASTAAVNDAGMDLTKLKKKELLEIMLRQGEEIDALRAEVEKLQAELEARRIDIARVGSLAEASLAVTEIFKEADKAAMTYLANLKRMAEEGLRK